MLDEKGLICLDGNGTGLDIVHGQESVLDLTLVSENMAGKSLWKVLKKSTIGSDHNPIFCSIGTEVQISEKKI